jgi:hypothetical protein
MSVGIFEIPKTCENGPWLCAGNFNEILTSTEKFGRRRRPRYLKENFRTTLEYCGLFEIPCRGSVFTWNNGKEGDDFTKEKLDRVVANHAWHNLFPNVDSSVELVLFSNHLPLTIYLSGSMGGRRKGRCFRYEAGWGDNHECKEVIKKIWRVKGR